MHDRDPVLLGVARIARGVGNAVELETACVRPHRPRQDAHQRALAGAVLADDRVDLAGASLERDAAQRDRRAEALGDPARR